MQEQTWTRKGRTFSMLRAAAHQVFSGCVSLRTKCLRMKGPKAFPRIYTGITPTAPKFVFTMHREECEHNRYVLMIFYVHPCLLFLCILWTWENGLIATSRVCLFQSLWATRLNSCKECFYNRATRFFCQVTPSINKWHFD